MKKIIFMSGLTCFINFTYAQLSFSELNDAGGGEIAFEVTGTAPLDLYSFYVEAGGNVDLSSESVTTVTSSPQCLGQSGLNVPPSSAFGFVIAKDTDGDNVADTLLDFVSGRGSITIIPSPGNPTFLYGVTSTNVGNETPVETQAFRKVSGSWTGPTASVCIPPVLPIELMAFGAKYDAYTNTVKLNWSTASEKNFSHFEVKRRTENSGWIDLGEVKGNGNSTSTRHYSFSDQDAAVGHVYYRLDLIDRDGTKEYSKVVHVQTKKDYFSVNNPVSSDLRLKVGKPIEMMELVSMSGRVIQKWNDLEAGDHNIILPANLTSGMYFLRTQTDIKKIIVSK